MAYNHIAESNTVSDSSTTTGTVGAVSLETGKLRSDVDLWIDVSGSATLTVEVSTTGDFDGEEHEVLTEGFDTETDLRQFDFAYPYVRAYVDANLNELEIVASGV